MPITAAVQAMRNTQGSQKVVGRNPLSRSRRGRRNGNRKVTKRPRIGVSQESCFSVRPSMNDEGAVWVVVAKLMDGLASQTAAANRTEAPASSKNQRRLRWAMRPVSGQEKVRANAKPSRKIRI